MQRSGFCLTAVLLCCLQAASDSSRDDISPTPEGATIAPARPRRVAENKGLALSREIFRNITKQLRQSIGAKSGGGSGENSDHLLQNKVDEHRSHGPHQGAHHHEDHWGPYFEGEGDEGSERPLQVSGHVGSEALLSCRVGMLKEKTVMWLRRTTDAVQLLTVGLDAHSGDPRVRVRFQYPNNWRLSIDPVRRSDAGFYMCQISTHPPRAILANLTVLAPIITINNDESHEVRDRYYKTGSSIELLCSISPLYAKQFINTEKTTTTTAPTTTKTPKTTQEPTAEPTKTSLSNMIELVANKSWSVETTTVTTTSVSTVKLKTSTVVTTTTPITTTVNVVNNMYGLVWKKQGKVFSEGVRMGNTSSTFVVSSASQNDSGTYSCHLPDRASASVNVHVLIIGENQAAVHHDTGNRGLLWKPHALLSSAIITVTLVIT